FVSIYSREVDLQKHGRLDFEYVKRKWEAKDCDMPLFSAIDMLRRLKNKRVIIVGDSLNRNMWESLSCLLYSFVSPSTTKVDAETSE
ncbi:Protein trichome birefringence-like 6, partial [Bienertia sinuspersici]